MRFVAMIPVLASFLALAAVPGRTAAAADDYAPLDFHTLGDFAIEPPPSAYEQKLNIKKLKPLITSLIPKSVKALDGHRVQVSGFMLPLDEAEGGTRKFILMRNQITCCFGGANKINEYVVVTMNGTKPAPFAQGATVTVLGTLSVGAEFEDGAFNGIYQMAGDEVRE